MWLLAVVSSALAASVTIVADGPGAVRVQTAQGVAHVPACRGVSWERFDPEKGGFEAVSGPACGPTAPALRIDENGMRFSFDGVLPPAPASGVIVVRPVVVIGEKCRDSLPFELSQCAVVRPQRGPNLVLRPGV
jgi:hypothetical protein